MVVPYPMRAQGLELSPMDDGYMIHEEARDRVHYLNPTAAAVWQLCDGVTSVDEIRALLQQYFALDEPPSAEIAQILDQFADEGLIECDGAQENSLYIGSSSA
jgi:hypothetical protein